MHTHLTTRHPHGTHALPGHLPGLQPHPLPPGPALSGQPATTRIPHNTGLDPRETPITQARRV